MPPKKKALSKRTKSWKLPSKKDAGGNLSAIHQLVYEAQKEIQIDAELKKNKELKVLDENELLHQFAECNSTYLQNKASAWELQCWNRYVYRSRDLNPLDLRQLNAYLTDWEEDVTSSIANLFHDFRICRELFFLWWKFLLWNETVWLPVPWTKNITNATLNPLKMCKEIKCGLLESSEINYKIVKAWIESIKNLQFMMRKKIDVATFEFLMAGNEYINDESFNIEYCITDEPEKDISIPPITMCLWGNLSKNLRHKGMDLPEIGLSFELPPDLIRINCAVRILHSLFDFATPSFSATSLPKFFSLGNIPTQETYFETLLQGIYSENYSQQKEIHKEEALLGKGVPTAGKLTAAVENALSGKVDSEKSSAMVFTPPEEPEITIVDHCEYFVVGGFYHFDLLQLPTPTLKVDCWVFTYCEDKVLKHIPYHTSIIPIRHPKPDMSPAVAAEFADSEIKRFDKEMCSAISISIQLSEEILFLEQPLPAFWLEDRKGFTTIGFYETKHDEDTGRLFFKTNHFGIIGMLQRKYNNMPYQSWELTSDGQANCATLLITGMHVGVQIEILDGECCIKKIEQDGKSLFPKCYCIWMSPDKLVKKLAFMGINIVVENDVDKYVETSKKEEKMESWTYSCMSVLCHAFNFYWSRWNATLPKDQMVLKYRAQNSDEPEKFSHILIMPDTSVVIKCAESHSKFCDDPADGEKKWKDLYHLVKERNEEEIPIAKHFQFVNAIYFFLSTCKLFSCS